jgi:hypothetical protein
MMSTRTLAATALVFFLVLATTLPAQQSGNPGQNYTGQGQYPSSNQGYQNTGQGYGPYQGPQGYGPYQGYQNYGQPTGIYHPGYERFQAPYNPNPHANIGTRYYGPGYPDLSNGYAPYPGAMTGEYPGQYQGYPTQSGSERIRGKVLRTKEVEVRGTDFQVLAAQVQRRSGERVIVDLGATEDLKEHGLNIKKGDEISVRGRFVQVGPYRVLLADRVADGGKSADIDRSWVVTTGQLRREEEFDHQGGEFGNPNFISQPGLRRQGLAGEITALDRITLPGSEEPLRVAQLKTEQGRPVTAILGFDKDLSDLKLQKGEEISLRGQTFMVEGREVVLADRITADQETAQGFLQHVRPGVRVTGEITQLQDLQVPGMKEPVTLATLHSGSRGDIVAVLGPRSDLHELGLKKGGRVTLFGELIQVHDRPVFLTRTAAANGQTVEILREDQQVQR